MTTTATASVGPRAGASPSAAPADAASKRAVDVRRPVFIAGVGRSGTSLLHSMLNAHPDVAFPPETHFFRRYVARGRTRRAVAAGTVADLRATLAADHDLRRASVDLDDLLAGERDGSVDTARVFEALLAAVARRSGKARVGDKDPRSIDHLRAIAAVFPDALVLHVIRDPREVLLSRTKAEWSKGRPWWQHALLAEDQLRTGRRLGPKLFGDRYLEVRYEALVSAPEHVLGEVARHIGVVYSPTMLDFSASAASLVDARERSWKKETLGPLLQGNREKWRVGLAPRQVRFVEEVSVEAFERLGYERSLGTPAGAHATGVGLARRASRAVFWLRRAVEASR